MHSTLESTMIMWSVFAVAGLILQDSKHARQFLPSNTINKQDRKSNVFFFQETDNTQGLSHHSHIKSFVKEKWRFSFCNLVYHFVLAWKNCSLTFQCVSASLFITVTISREKPQHRSVVPQMTVYPVQTDIPSRWTVQYFIALLSYQECTVLWNST